MGFLHFLRFCKNANVSEFINEFNCRRFGSTFSIFIKLFTRIKRSEFVNLQLNHKNKNAYIKNMLG